MTSKCILVAGLHRSGTSSVAGVLHHLGVNMGERLLPATEANPRGFYEDLDFIDIHFKIMGEWWGPEVNFPPFAQEYRELIQQREKQSLWGLKEPRLCYLLWEFASSISKNTDLRFIVVNRPTEDVIRSINTDIFAPGTSLATARRVAAEYLVAREISLRRVDQPKLIVEYNRLVDYPMTVISEIADFVGVPLDPKVVSFIEPKLRRSQKQVLGGDLYSYLTRTSSNSCSNGS